MTRLAHHEERRAVAIRDLAELAGQAESGEIDEATADVLRRRYEREAATAAAALDRARGQVDPDPAVRSSRSGRRGVVLVGATAVTGVVAAVVLVGGATTERPEGGFVTGNEATAGRDLAEVTTTEMEAVVADNPDIVPMRLRLAHRYLDDGQNDRALDHYLAVLEREDHPEAASHAGWIVFLDGRADLARQLLEASLATDPTDAEATWFLANVALYGDDDPDAALVLTAELLERDDLGDQRAEVEDLADLARERAEQR